VLKQAAQQVWQRNMEEKENKKPLSIGINENSFELVLRILGNEFIAIRIGSTNFSGKLIAGSILLLFFTFMLLEVFGLSRMLGIE
jgi:ADP-dependent phosphofructokinase/glucokinase